MTGLQELAGQPARNLGTPNRKRLEIARVMATEPRLVLLDEALAGLTPAEIQRAIDLVRQIHQAGVTLVIVEHIMEVIVTLAERVLVFNQGHVIASGRPAEAPDSRRILRIGWGQSMRSRVPSASTARHEEYQRAEKASPQPRQRSCNPFMIRGPGRSIRAPRGDRDRCERGG